MKDLYKFKELTNVYTFEEVWKIILESRPSQEERKKIIEDIKIKLKELEKME